jgi:hypothetical protein
MSAGSLKDATGIKKDLTGIEKDRVEIKLAEKKLEESERIVQPATFEDVKAFDPKLQRIKKYFYLMFFVIVLISGVAGFMNTTVFATIRRSINELIGKLRGRH